MNILSRNAKNRCRWMLYFEKYKNSRLTCRHFGISPSTFYHWKRKYNPENLQSLEDTASRRPKNLRRAKWNFQTLILIQRLLENRPHSKNKAIQVFLAKQGVQLSASTMTRVMKQYRNYQQQLG
ncbi:MAG: helix-turn-helix domain-containing protein [Candidatus Levybacteria bacterium]|nr:helix-turn-helix domain-containing protein [Candidatus Levybacteria bacterium]